MTKEPQAFEVNVERDGQWWFAKAPAVAGAYTQTRRLDQVAGEIRPLIAYFAEIPEDSFEVKVKIDLNQDLRSMISEFQDVRREADQVSARASELTRELVQRLADDGMPQRDVGSLLGLSFQRVSQLLKHRPAGAAR